MLPNAARFPKVIVSGIVGVLTPINTLIFEVFFVGVGQRSHAEKEIIAILGAKLKRDPERGRGRFALALDEAMIEAEVRREHEGPIVIRVIAEVIVSDGRLRRGGHQGGVRVDHPG